MPRQNVFRGDSKAVAQVNVITVGGTPAVGQVYTVTVNGKTVSYTALGPDTNTTIATALAALLTASVIVEIKECTYAAATTTIVVTASAPGKPFTQASSATGGGTLITATTIASQGPSHVDDPLNWTLGLPLTGDDIFFQFSRTAALYGLEAFSDVIPNTLNFLGSYTGLVGLPDMSDSSGGGGGYREYRPKYLKFKGCTEGCFIGRGLGNGSSRIKLDFGDTDHVTVNIEKTGTQIDQSLPAVIIKGAGGVGDVPGTDYTGEPFTPDNVLNISQGSVGLALEALATANFPTIRLGSKSSPASDVQLFCGPGAILNQIFQSGGDVVVNTNIAYLEITDGTYQQIAGSLASLIQDGGSILWTSEGGLTVGVVRSEKATLDFSRDLRPKSIGDLDVSGGAKLLDPQQILVFTNPFRIDRESLKVSDLGAVFSLQRS